MYPVVDSYRFPLVSSRVECVCDCPGGAARCGHRGHDMCGNTTQVTWSTLRVVMISNILMKGCISSVRGE